MFLSIALLGRACLCAAILTLVSAQSSSSPASSASSSPTPTPSANVTVIAESTSFTTTTLIRSGNQNVPVPTVLPTVVNVTLTLLAPTPTANASASASPSASQTSDPYVLATKVDPAFGVLGAILILTGLPSAFLGHKNRWTSFFLIGFYTLSLVCFVLIVKFGILPAVNPPTHTLRGMFVLSSVVAGVAGGGVAIFFWKATKYLIGAWGGFAFALWIQCFRDGGLIRPIGIRWILYIGCAVVGFVLCTIPKLHYHVLLLSTAIVGSSAIILGVDCYTTAGLKEFYIWNLGFRSLYPKFTSHNIQFPVSQTMEIELGLIGAIGLMGMAVQFRILGVLQRKLKEIKAEQRRREALDDSKAAERFSRLDQEKAEWEKEHPSLGKHGRQDSEFSGTPLMKDNEFSSSGMDDSGFGGRPRRPSGLSEFLAASAPEDEGRRPSRNSQLLGALPALDLGTDLQGKLPRGYISEDQKDSSSNDFEDLKRKEELLQEIQSIRRSIDVLKSETPQASSSSTSRRPSLNSRRTSYDLNSILPAAHLRPPRAQDPRTRAQSMDMTNLVSQEGQSINRPTSAPLRDPDWDSYVRDRKVLQPPSGVSAPINTTPIPVIAPTPRITVPPAVQEALMRRQKRETMLELGVTDVGRTPSPGSSGEAGITSSRPHHRRSSSSANPAVGSYTPPTILPPRKAAVAPPAAPARTVTYEELSERHREKLRELQAPLTQAENEVAEVTAARARWERSKAAERTAVAKRQADKAQAVQAKRRGSEDTRGERSRAPPPRHSRSKSADRLSGMPPPMGGGGSSRLSTMKVEDWQRYQAEADTPADAPARGKRESKVPFPGQQERRASRANAPRDPPN
ncbi:hypothetical protein BV25DRAFT_1794373 [Artomyces pyxidatus]|uniref:Uncharacterized protein n=1 Tax=Artomyces pyxidatus TaxID=48021 RepID=A0ACB8TH81_9AGAM|nr:hypothetical protein BV25DRAFT_1794373 [Artomyces pyxidatus]